MINTMDNYDAATSLGWFSTIVRYYNHPLRKIGENDTNRILENRTNVAHPHSAWKVYTA